MGDALDHSTNNDPCQHPYGSVEEQHLQLRIGAVDDLDEDINISADICSDCDHVIDFNGLDSYSVTRLNDRLCTDDECVHPYAETTETTVTLAHHDTSTELQNTPTIRECVLCTACMQLIETSQDTLTPQ